MPDRHSPQTYVLPKPTTSANLLASLDVILRLSVSSTMSHCGASAPPAHPPAYDAVQARHDAEEEHEEAQPDAVVHKPGDLSQPAHTMLTTIKMAVKRKVAYATQLRRAQ